MIATINRMTGILQCVHGEVYAVSQTAPLISALKTGSRIRVRCPCGDTHSAEIVVGT